MRYYLLILVSILLIKHSFGQDPLIRHFTTHDGLPSSTIYPMMQDKDGFIWFGTDVGVTRFDGKNFKNFTLKDGLSDNYILKVKQDSKGRIWFLGFNGTVSYWLKGKIYNARSDSLLKGITSSNSFVDLFEDNEKKLWFMSLYEYIILDKNNITTIDPHIIAYAGIVMNGKSGQIIMAPLQFSPNETGKNFQYLSGKVHSLNLKYKVQQGGGYWHGKDGSLLFISNQGLVKQNDTFQRLIIPFSSEFNDQVRYGSLALSGDSLLWITSLGKGLYRFDLKDPKAKPLIYLKDKLITGVTEDKEGDIWISTNNEGIFMIPAFSKQLSVIGKEQGLIPDQCFAINKLITGELLVGLENAKLHLISGDKTSEIKITECDKANNKIYRITNRNDDVWISTECGLIHKNLKTGCDHFLLRREIKTKTIERFRGIKDMTLGRDNIYFVSGFRPTEYPLKCPGNSFYITVDYQMLHKRTYSLYCDHSSRLWYGTLNGLQSKKGVQIFNHYKEDILLTSRINCIAETEDSTLILATHGHGVLFYKNGKVINRVTTAAGLCNDICRKIFVHQKHIYISTPSGVSVLFYSGGKIQSIQNLNTGNFLPSNDVNDVFVDDKDISVATMEGVAIIKQTDFENIKPIIPILHINEIRVNDSLILARNESNFPYNKNSLKFNFIGIYYLQPDAVIYRYRLKSGQSWQVTKNTELEFSFLPPGKYSFQLQARVSDGTWSQVKIFAFTIKPPFWKTWWFILLLILTFLILVGTIALYRIRQIKRISKIKLQAINAELQALRSQMNPHFVFNSLNSIQDFVLNNQKKEASIYLSDFALLMRMTLENARREQLPLSEEIVFLTKYVEMEQLRCNNSFQFSVEVDENITSVDCEFPSMLLQPFIENSIHHGLSGRTNGLLILSFLKQATDLLCMIEDNGSGRVKVNADKPSAHKSAALDIITSRIEKYNSEGSFKIRMTIEDLTDANGLASGTKIVLIFSGYFS